MNTLEFIASSKKNIKATKSVDDGDTTYHEIIRDEGIHKFKPII